MTVRIVIFLACYLLLLSVGISSANPQDSEIGLQDQTATGDERNAGPDTLSTVPLDTVCLDSVNAPVQAESDRHNFIARVIQPLALSALLGGLLLLIFTQRGH